MHAPWKRTLNSPEQIERERQGGLQSRVSLRSLFLYLGPALIVSMAYMDPGNYGTDIAGGAGFNYNLVWAVVLANIMAMQLQYLSGKLGIATGKSLPELVRGSLGRRRYVVPYWLASEAAAAATDLAEYLGTVIALNLLFGIPLLISAVVGAFDVIILLGLMSRRFRVIEQFFMLFVSVIGIGFLYELVIIRPSVSQMLVHTIPYSLNSEIILLVVGMIGATVMPHALFVHSWLTARKLNEHTVEEKRRLLKLHLSEDVIMLTIAGLVNIAILIAAAAAFFPRYSNVSTINQAYGILIPLFGPFAAVVFAVTLLSSGLASSTTGTIAGQVIMDGLLGTKVNVYLRRVVTRVINVFPTTIAIYVGLNPLSILVYSQVILSLMIPLPMIPLISYTSKRSVMGEFVNSRSSVLIAVVFAFVIIALNAYLITTIL
jgi:manganese transport protein